MGMKRAVTEASIPADITRDSETMAAIAAAIAKTLSLFPRSAGKSISANNCLMDSSAGFMWLDGDITHTNVPAGTGTLFQLLPLWGTPLETFYRIQIMIPGGSSPSNTTLLFVRHQNNGTWTTWRSI